MSCSADDDNDISCYIFTGSVCVEVTVCGGGGVWRWRCVEVTVCGGDGVWR
jgi:hypothetical protein